MKPIPYGRQNITDDDIREVNEALRSDYLTQGPRIAEFEEAFAKYVGAKYAVAVANGTAALHLCALALDVQPGHKVITTPITFAASANCVRYCGGEVVFSDIDPKTFLLDIDKVESLLSKNPKGTFKGIIPVDFGGLAVDIEAYRKLADKHGLWLIEDACHAPGGFSKGKSGVEHRCGDGVAELSIFSFHPVKHIASGEGGMIATNSEALYRKLIILRTHGITREQGSFQNSVTFASGGEATQGPYPGWYMEMQTLGFNYRITDFQAALGLSQLKRADEGLKRRRAIARKYDEAFSGHPHVRSQLLEMGNKPSGHAYHLYVIKAPRRLELYNFLRDQKIFAQVHYIPAHLMPYYRGLGWKEGDMPAAEEYYRQCLSLPMFPTLTDEQQTFVIGKIKEFYN